MTTEPVKVRMKTSIAGHAEPMYSLSDFSFRIGEVVDLDPKLAQAWIGNDFAEAVRITELGLVEVIK